MTDRNEDENSRLSPEETGDAGETGPDRDLRSIMGVSVPAPSPGSPTARPERQEPRPEQPPRREPDTSDQAPPYGQEDEEEVPPPYVPPVREGDEYERRRRLERPPEPEPETEARPERRFEQSDEKLPPVWPGDEDQPWFRKERGLPPIPQSERVDGEKVDPQELPTPLATTRSRGRAFGLNFVAPNVLGLIPGIGFFIGLGFLFVNLFLYRQGQDIGALAFRLRVVRDNGDVAGFFTMFVRNTASAISFLALGFGYWAAFSDPYRRTWHDRWLGTYVVDDAPEYRTRKRSSSQNAKNWFWIILLLAIAITLLFTLSTAPLPETTLEGTPTPGDAPTEAPSDAPVDPDTTA